LSGILSFIQLIIGIAAGRKISVEEARAQLLRGIVNSNVTQELVNDLCLVYPKNLNFQYFFKVDGIFYQEDVYKALSEHLMIAPKKLNYLFWDRYAQKKGKKYGEKSKHSIALIYAVGNIYRGNLFDLSVSLL
jgi:hypothetical protein